MYFEIMNGKSKEAPLYRFPDDVFSLVDQR